MRSFAIAVIAALLVAALLSAASRPAEAKCGEWAMLDVQPPGSHEYSRYVELAWGDTVSLSGFCWAEWDAAGALVWTPDEVELLARFVHSRADAGGERPGEPDLVVSYAKREGFEASFDLDDVPNAPDPPAPGWIEFTARAGEMEVQTYVMVTADGARPPGSAYVTGRVHNMPPPPYGIYLIWAPVDDPSAYRYTIVPNSGEYRTDYLSEGEWFVGIYDINEEQQAVGPDVQPVTRYSRDLDREITLMGRTVTIPANQPVDGFDFTLTDPPASGSGAPPTPDPAQAARAAPVEAQDDAPAAPATQLEKSDGGSAGWLGPALLGTGGGLILAMAATTRWWRLRRWQ